MTDPREDAAPIWFDPILDVPWRSDGAILYAAPDGADRDDDLQIGVMCNGWVADQTAHHHNAYIFDYPPNRDVTS